MLDHLFRRLALRGKSHPPRTLPPGTRIYAIGDVHGQVDLLAKLLQQISDDVAKAPVGTLTMLVMLGDYIDRGLGSREVIEALSKLSGFPTRLRFLKGNHEQAMLAFLADPGAGPVWVQHGGGETLASYGVKPPAPDAPGDLWEAARSALLNAIPDHHTRFLDELEHYVLIEPYLFVHAGVDPDKPLKDQTEQDLLWIRDRFLYSSRQLEYIIVHGHTPEQAPFRDERRIGIDTGAYITGVLTAVRLEADTAHFMQVRR